jgi:hypothetical protein
MTKANDKSKTGEEIGKAIYEPQAERWQGIYYPGLPFLPVTDDELLQLAKAHAYSIEFVRGLYISQKEKVKDASNPSA